MGRLILLNQQGDSETRWNVKDPASVSTASTRFATLAGKGTAAFALCGAGPATQIDHFDPTADEIIIVPQMKGG